MKFIRQKVDLNGRTLSIDGVQEFTLSWFNINKGLVCPFQGLDSASKHLLQIFCVQIFQQFQPIEACWRQLQNLWKCSSLWVLFLICCFFCNFYCLFSWIFSRTLFSLLSIFVTMGTHTLISQIQTSSLQNLQKLKYSTCKWAIKKKPSLQQLKQLLFLLLYHSFKSSLLHCDCRGCWENYDVFCRRSGVTTRPVRVRVCRKVPKTVCQVFLSVMLKVCQPVVTSLHANYKPDKSHVTLMTTGNNKMQETEAKLSLVLIQDCHCTYHGPGWPSPKTFHSAT